MASTLRAPSKPDTQVIYARVAEQLKVAADAYAAQSGATLATTVAHLLERGLEATTNEKSIRELEARVQQLTGDNATIQAELRAGRSGFQTLTALSRRAQQHVGTCPDPACGKSITGYDLLATGTCPSCGRALSGLLLSGKQNADGLNQQEFLLLLGALGALVGVAPIAGKGP